MTPAHPQLMLPCGHFCSELRSCFSPRLTCVLPATPSHSQHLPASPMYLSTLPGSYGPLSLQPLGDGLRLSFEGPGMPCQDFTRYPESNQESLKVIIKQRLTGSGVYKRQVGWERDGGNVVIIRHLAPNGFSQGIPFRPEQQLSWEGHCRGQWAQSQRA